MQVRSYGCALLLHNAGSRRAVCCWQNAGAAADPAQERSLSGESSRPTCSAVLVVANTHTPLPPLMLVHLSDTIDSSIHVDVSITMYITMMVMMNCDACAGHVGAARRLC
jgi:hypothetical protein